MTMRVFPLLIRSVWVIEHLFILDSHGRFSPFRSPTNKKAPAIARAQVSEVGKVHPFGNRSSQNAAPRLQTAWPLVCS
jgi:hypothetical protein